MSTVEDVVRVTVPPRSIRHDLRAVKIVWQRELIRTVQERMRIVGALVQPLLWLAIMGTGLTSLVNAGGGIAGLDLRTFLFPGMLAMTVVMPAIFASASIVWDREFGFLREMLVAPVSRTAIVVGKCLGGATVATAQGCIVLALAGLVGVPYAPSLILALLGMMLLLSLSLTALGTVLAARMKSMQSFMAVMQVGIMPMLFLSGAMFPLANLPAWLSVLTRINPLTYAVDPMRQVVFSHLDLPVAAQQALNPGVTWFGWHVPVALELGMIAGIGAVLLAAAIALFSKTD
jgi:ABC-2 type transport system permease protein